MGNNRIRKYTHAVLAMALAVVMCLGVTVPSLAANGTAIEGTEANPVTAAITKVLVMPEGTITPTARFEFEFAKKSFNGSSATAELAKMPNVNTTNTMDINFTSADTGSATGGIKEVPKESAELTAKIPFTEVGVYIYTIKEKSGTYTINNAFNETMDYSNAQYDITFWVREKADGSGVYVHAVAAIIKVKDTDDQGNVDTKVDPTPGGGSSDEYDYSQMTFTNTYHYIKGGTDPDKPENEALRISKVVSGDMAEKTRYFAFSVTVQKPATLTGTVLYRAYVVDASNTVVTSSNHVPAGDIQSDKGFDLTAGTAKTVNLKHNERIVFNAIHVGAKYSVTETGVPDYVPSVVVVENGGTPTTTPPTGSIGQSLSIGAIMIGKDANSAAFTNTYKDVPITGVVIDNLPFILLIVSAIGGLVFFVVVKYRKGGRVEN